jgi:lipopolysaccharide/colanic/teichoic acid biosynthesis glycosyltransferase
MRQLAGTPRDGGKRIFDVLMSVGGVILLSPVLILLTIVVAVGMGRPVLFIQSRPGQAGNLFLLYKFRTMKHIREKDDKEVLDRDRLTGLGRWMRKWSLDELPELFNVLKGDMSLVGPRPLLVQYLDRYTPEQARRHEVKPGITGWAQINGRNAITWEEKFALDVWYVDNRSLWLDLKILAVTAWKVLMREGISAKGEATMPEFMGTIPTDGKSENA